MAAIRPIPAGSTPKFKGLFPEKKPTIHKFHEDHLETLHVILFMERHWREHNLLGRGSNKTLVQTK